MENQIKLSIRVTEKSSDMATGKVFSLVPIKHSLNTDEMFIRVFTDDHLKQAEKVLVNINAKNTVLTWCYAVFKKSHSKNRIVEKSLYRIVEYYWKEIYLINANISYSSRNP